MPVLLWKAIGRMRFAKTVMGVRRYSRRLLRAGDSFQDRSLLRLVCAALSLLASAWLLPGCAPGEAIAIGFIGGMSGRVADLGIAGRDAAQLAVEQRNQAGGIAGRQVKLLIRDDEQNTVVAERALRELIDQGVVAIVGPMTSAIAMTIVPIANRAGVLLISPTVSTEALTGKDDYFFRVGSSNLANATQVAQYHLRQAAGRQNPRRLVAVYDLNNRPYAETWLDGFRVTYVRGGGEIVKSIGFESGSAISYRQLAQELLATAADGVLIVANSVDTALLCQQIRKSDRQIPIIAAEWAASERLLELGGKAVDGVVVGQNFDRSSTAPRYQAFRQAYLARFQREPGFGGVLAYDATNVLLDALARQQRGQSVKQTVLAIGSFEGTQAPIVFDAYGDVQRNVFITVVRDGRLVVVE